jgi:5-methylcytosine-specific restriction endonuclease McrA
MQWFKLTDRKESPGGKCSCGSEDGSIEPKNGQDCVYCNECGKYLFNAPKTLTGRKKRTLATTHAAITPKVRTRIIERANGLCETCGSPSLLTVGHVVSVADGHANGLTDEIINSDENLICQCGECNSGTGKRTIPLQMYVRILLARSGNGTN